MKNLTPRLDFKTLLGLLATVILPAIFALLPVHVANITMPLQPQSSPLGYWRSLTFFIIPAATILFWIHRNPGFHFQRRAFYGTVIPLTLIGFILDFFFGLLFFHFPNHGATIGLWLPAWDWASFSWQVHSLPIEEFLFYASGFAAALLIYMWCDEYWFAAYNISNYRNEVKKIDRLIHLHYPSLWTGVILILAAILYKKFGPHPYQKGFPGYFTFLVTAAIIPALLLFKSVCDFINWRAVSFSLFIILVISLLWETTLALPYGWWGYHPEQMIGIMIKAWTNLPVEAVILWLAVIFTTVIIYETIKILQASDRPKKVLLLGRNSQAE